MSWQHKVNFIIVITLSILIGATITATYIFSKMQRPSCYPEQALVNVNNEYVCLYVKDLKGGL